MGNNASYENSFITCQITPNYRGSLLDSLVNMQLALGNPFSGQIVADYFFGKAYWATPFKMHFDFRLFLWKTCAKISLSADPSHRQGTHQRKSKHQGPWCWALAKPHSWKLSGCVRSLLLETSQSNVRQYQRQSKNVLQNYGIWLWRSLTFWKPGCYIWREKGKANVRSPAPNSELNQN